MSKLNILAEIEGYNDYMDLLDEYITDSVCPGICTNIECNYTCEVEPDQNKGWCEICNTNSVSSGMVLAGVI